MKILKIIAITATFGLAVALGAKPARADIITYDVNLNFDPVTGNQPGLGTVTGTVTIDTSIPIQGSSNPGPVQPTDVTAVDLTENTHGFGTIGGAFGSPTETSFVFNQVAPFTTIFFGQPQVFQTSTAAISQKSDEFNGNPFITLFFRTDCCTFDAQPIGPTITFDFPFPDGGSIQPGIFDSITSENRYLFGTVTVASDEGGSTSVPEPASWVIAIVGIGLLGVLRARQKGIVAG
ncbi:hypothetical protein GCM10011611_00020 [Aliidongia dinghuensis]|uniref:Ice-binding protein C-terminal domain-containing protein n=1 Tax=Aliidongia dinghuensis TaxID=1867774 RepID=A0A8J3E153_9PROT|nr:PEP-CTERM sorting domain-containing protein [Aliidongia dinghuensis]GGE98532.1 hypothetical protein GCM10011611_00020 [Aliidongia dinghuensis]